MFTLNCHGKLLVVNRPLVMGILNFTDDSFYRGSHLKNSNDLFVLAQIMVDESVDILDIGAQSTRPGSHRVKAENEIQKLESVIPGLKEKYPGVLISVDTYYAEVASFAIGAGADLINDISGGTLDGDMIKTVGQLNVPYICMHMKGSPENMQNHTDYEDILKELLDFFIKKIDECKNAGIRDIIIDPGFGFAKNIEQNFYLLKNLSLFKMLEKPILAGLSRKSSIYRTLSVTAEEALNGTTVLNTIALLNGADILRVHDVKEAKETIQLVEKLKNSIG